jgi:DNA-binding MarR family transcriptional regulator
VQNTFSNFRTIGIFVSTSALDLDKQICHALYSASNAMVRAYRPMLEPLGLTYPQYVTMMSLWQHNNVSIKQLSLHTRLDSGTLTPLLKRLEAKGLLLRKHSLEDERQKVISLTKAGLHLKKQAGKVPEQLVAKTSMQEKDALKLKQLCEKLLEDLA